MKILIVDDNEDARMILRSNLENKGHTVEEASNGAEALKKAGIIMPDMIVSDIMMPVMDGYELCRRVKKDTNLRRIPFIFYTATYVDPQDEALAMSMGASRFIVKPMEFEKFLHNLNEIFQDYRDEVLHLPTMPLKHDAELDKMHDASVSRKLEKKLNDLEELNRILVRKEMELEQKNRELEQIVYVSSHDLRSPLVNISGYSSQFVEVYEKLNKLLENSNIPDEIRKDISASAVEMAESLGFIRSSTLKMAELLKGLLGFTRSGRVGITSEEIDMNRLISEIAKTFESKLKETGAKLEASALPECSGDSVQINQVFSNLIDNAIKFLDPSRKGIIKVSGHKEKGNSVYCVEDNGIGIRHEYQNKIFDVFNQVDPQVGGEGLGLSIVKRIIDRHNGKIWIESEEGKGSKFYISLKSV